MSDTPTTEDALATSLSLSPRDLAHELDTAITAVITAVSFVERFPFFPTQYKSALDELLKVLNFSKGLLDKV